MEKSCFFNSNGGDRLYSAADFAGYFSKLVSNGIFYAVSTNLLITVLSGMAVAALPGSAWINGYSYENTAELELTLEMANGIYPRIDRVVLRWSAVDRNIKLAIKTGTAAASPSAPTLTRTADIYELGLADSALTTVVTVLSLITLIASNKTEILEIVSTTAATSHIFKYAHYLLHAIKI